MSRSFKHQSFHTGEEDAVEEEAGEEALDLEAGMANGLQFIGSKVLDLGAVFTGGIGKFSLEEFRRLHVERALLRPLFEKLIPLMENTEQVAGQLIDMTEETTMGRAAIAAFVGTTIRRPNDSMLMTVANKAILAHEVEKKTMETVCKLLDELSAQWAHAASCADGVKNKFGARIESLSEDHVVCKEQKQPFVAAASSVGIAALALTVFVAHEIHHKNIEVAVIVTGVSCVIAKIVKHKKWLPGYEDGILEATKKLLEACRLERDVSEALKILLAVREQLGELAEAVRKQADEGTTTGSQAAGLKMEAARKQDRRFFAMVLTAGAEAENGPQKVVDWLIELKKDSPDALDEVSAALNRESQSASDLVNQLRVWKQSASAVKSAMTVLLSTLYGEEVATRFQKNGTFSAISPE